MEKHAEVTSKQFFIELTATVIDTMIEQLQHHALFDSYLNWSCQAEQPIGA